jgi:hypothetical protein
MGMMCLIGAVKAFSLEYADPIRRSVRILGGIFLYLFPFYTLLAFANSFLSNPHIIQIVIYFALFFFLFVGVGHGVYLDFLLLGKKTVGLALVATFIGIAAVLFVVQLMTAPLPVLLKAGTLFAYWNPQFSLSTVLVSYVWVLIGVSFFSASFLKAAVATQSPVIREKSFFMSSGAFLAGVAGTFYFGSHILASTDTLPYFISIVPVFGVIGFLFMSLPLFISKPFAD